MGERMVANQGVVTDKPVTEVGLESVVYSRTTRVRVKILTARPKRCAFWGVPVKYGL